jgi:hypothetical protein
MVVWRSFMKTQYDNYPICHVSREVRDYLRESDKELKRQQDQDYQYGVFFHAFDMEERVRGDPGRNKTPGRRSEEPLLSSIYFHTRERGPPPSLPPPPLKKTVADSSRYSTMKKGKFA